MSTSLLEISQRKDKAGRRNIKVVLHEIHSDNSRYNENGITWLEEYVAENLSSAEGMPLCCQFIDEDKDVPYGHGEVSEKDGQLIFKDSTVVGSIQKAYIDTVEVNGRSIKAVVAEGFVYANRYPMFVEWMDERINNGENIDSSVEISGNVENNNRIVYEGGWKEKGRIPKVFSYIGHAILSIPPADNNAIILELNQKTKEDETMKDAVIELNNKIDEQRSEISSLKDEVKSHEGKVTELNEKVEAKQTELNSTIEELKELNAKLEAKDAELKELNESKSAMEAELNELKEYKTKIENQKLVGELNSKLANYSDEEKAVASEQIELFNKDPKPELMKDIISEINSGIAQKIVAERSKSKEVEVNSKTEDIYSDMFVAKDEEVSVEDLY